MSLDRDQRVFFIGVGVMLGFLFGLAAWGYITGLWDVLGPYP
jgi:hypothetical protein